MMKTVVLFLFLLGIFVDVYSQGACPTPKGPGICALTCRLGRPCGRGRLCCRTACGGSTCVNINGGGSHVPSWCPPKSPRLRCKANPCTVMKCPRIPLARCINDNPCEPTCSGNFYIGRLRIPNWLCKIHV